MALNFPTNPNNNDTHEGYVWVAAENAWRKRSPQLGDLSDIDASGAADGEVLSFDGTSWVNQELQIASTIEDLTDTTISSPLEGDTMVYDGSSWINTTSTPGNLVINGSFLVNQRGKISETPTISNGYIIDRWFLRQANSLSHEVTLLKNQSVNGFGFSNVLKISNFYDSAWVGQRIELQNYPFLSEKEVTVSFYAKSDSPISDLSVFLHEGADSGNHGAPYFTTTGAVNTAWQKYSYTMTIGTLAMDQINGNLLLGFGQQTTDTTFYLAGVQLEVGSVATPFRPAGDGSKAAELALCQRYYQKSGNRPGLEWYPGIPDNADHDRVVAESMYGNADRAMTSITFPVRMRVSPTVSYYPARSAVSNTVSRLTVYNANTLVSFSSAASSGVSGIQGHFSGTSTDGTMYTYQYTADAEL